MDLVHLFVYFARVNSCPFSLLTISRKNKYIFEQEMFGSSSI